MRPNARREDPHGNTSQSNTNGAGDPLHAEHHPLDDDSELEHIGNYTPPEIDVEPDSVCPETGVRAGYDSPPPMARPQPEPMVSSRVQHIAPLGPLADRNTPDAPTPLAPSEDDLLTPGDQGSGRKIRAFEQKLGGGGHESKWKRQPNVTGTGAIHVKSFHCKLTGDSLEFLDMQVNEWLDEHPEYEVKQVTTSIGEWTGKMKEPALIVNVWV